MVAASIHSLRSKMLENRQLQQAQNESQKNYSGTNELWANERSLKKYNHHIVSKFSSSLRKNDRILEFGAGIGTLASIFREIYSVEPSCIEIDPKLRKILVERNFTAYEDSQSANGPYDLIYTSNVLEHIPNDLEALKNIYGLLKSGGSLMIYVPAFMCLYSPADASLGHYRRYNKQELSDKLKQANFTVKICQFSDSIGFFAWLSTKFSRQTAGNKIGSDASLKFYDQFIFPISHLLDKLGCKYFFGKNIFIHATKK